jgi:hypothetical protein
MMATTTGAPPPYLSDTVAQVGTGMVAPVFCEVGAQLDPGQSIDPASVTAVLTERDTGAAVPAAIAAAPTVSGTKLVQVVDGSALAATHTYLLTFRYAPTPPDAVGEKLPAIQPIYCAL